MTDSRTGENRSAGPAQDAHPGFVAALEEGPARREPRSRARRWIVSLLAAGLLAAVAAHLTRSPEEVAAFGRLSLAVLATALVLQFLSQLCSSAALLAPLRTHVQSLGFWEFYVVRTGGFFAGYLVPVAGGVAVRLSYLKRRGLGYRDFAWATLVSPVLALVAAAVLAVGSVVVLGAVAGPPAAQVVGLSAVVLAASLAALTVFRLLPRLARHPALGRWRWLAGMSGLNASRPTMTKVFWLSLARHTLNFATFGWLYQSLAARPGGFLTGGLVYAIASPLRTVQITPGNLGVDEWAAAMVGGMLAFDVATGLIVALVFRGLVVLAQGLGVLMAWVWLARGSQS